MPEEEVVPQEEKPRKKAKQDKPELGLDTAVVPEEPAPEAEGVLSIAQEPKRVMSREELDRAGAITISQFLRSENLGYMKQGFAIHIRDKGIGGRKPRQEWMDMFIKYKQAPAVAFKQRRGN